MGRIAVVDYGVGNLKSVTNAMDYLGLKTCITSDARELELADAILLPGVGAFPDAADKLRGSGLDQVLVAQAQQKPILGICLGMQVLFEGSDEAPGVKGLGYFQGQVRKLSTALKIPHMGWNQLQLRNSSPLLEAAAGQYVYFVHSFHAEPQDQSIITAVCDYGMEVTASVGRGSVQAFQFHPEKSSRAGLSLLRAFKEWQP